MVTMVDKLGACEKVARSYARNRLRELMKTEDHIDTNEIVEWAINKTEWPVMSDDIRTTVMARVRRELRSAVARQVPKIQDGWMRANNYAFTKEWVLSTYERRRDIVYPRIEGMGTKIEGITFSMRVLEEWIQPYIENDLKVMAVASNK